jgi:serine-type D-Ala-D-Ala carboxypeptidase (penicillin-binding protein 5/6)
VAATERLEVKRLAPERLRLWAVGGAIAAAVAAILVWGIATEPTPALVAHRTLAAYVRFPGRPPALAWPREGQAAVEVEGLGSLGTTGALSPVPIASVAKVMTAYLTLHAHPLSPGAHGFVMTVTRADVAEQRQRVALGQSTVAVRAGERISELQALQALLLPSANNVATMLAEHDAGGVSGFVARMNATARALGMSSTTYTDPSGYRDDTVSTAADQLRLARAAMGDRVFAAVVAEPAAQLPVAGLVTNYNGLVGRAGYVGVKTGSDRAAGGCLMFAKRVVLAGRRLTVLGVVLGQHEGSPIEAALSSGARLGDSVADALEIRTLLGAGTRVLTLRSDDGREAAAVTAGPVREVGWAGLVLPLHVTAGANLQRLRGGERLGAVTVIGGGAQSTAVVASRPIGSPSLGWRLGHVL